MKTITKHQTIDNLPSPKGQLLMGNLKAFKTSNRHQVMEEWVKECGNLFSIRFAHKKFIVSANPIINTQILKKRPKTFMRFSKIDEIMNEMGIEGVFNVEGKQWEKHRKITAEALSAKNIKSFFPILEQMTLRLFDRWKNFNGKNVLDVQKEMMAYTIDITTNIAFGYDVNTLKDEENEIQQHIERIFPMINERISAPFPLWRYIPAQKDKDLTTSLNTIETHILEIIEHTKEKLKQNPSQKENPANFLESLLVQQETEQNFTDKEIYGNIFTLLLAGEDTTSNSISWMIFYLLQYPAVLEKITAEANEVLKDDLCITNYEQLQKLKYTEAVIHEVMRIKPVTPTLFMEALEDVTIENLEIKKGQTVMMQNKVPQTDEAYFGQADEFIPERWLVDKKEIPTSGCHFHEKHTPDVIKVFGGGPRFCPGKLLAIQELKMCISMIVKNFKLEFTEKPESVKEVFSFTMAPENLKIKAHLK